ncbi:MAG TPA: Ig-like domain-containing protein, partial [Flavobacteriales bacterium]|nr:Ig-like domain-containing protein [Flavobacteriales bacterium]
MRIKFIYALHVTALFLIPFLNEAQLVQVLAHSTSIYSNNLKPNHAPVACNDYKTMCQDAAPITVAVQANDYDPDGDLMVTTIVTGPANGTATVVGGTKIKYTPNPGFNGVDIITYKICDDGWPSMCDNASLTVTVKAAPVANAGADVSICAGSSAVIGTPAVSGLIYYWTPSAGLSSVWAAQPTASPSVTTTYTLYVKNSAKCIAVDEVTVTVVSPPDANAGADVSVCAGSSVMLGSPAVAGLTYSWSPATGLSSTTVAQPTATLSSTVTYTLTVSNGACSDVDNVCVTVKPLPTANAGADVSICPGSTAIIGSAAVSGHTYSWSPAIGLSSSTAAQPTANPAVTTTYTLTVTNTTTGCSNTDAVTVAVNALPTVNAGADVSICPGASAVIGTSASGGLSYSWSPATGLSSTTVAQPTANPSATTTYTLTATNGAGCTASDAVVVTVNAMPAVNAGADASICIGGSTVIGTAASAGLTYSWSPAVGLSSSTVAQPTANPSATTTYTLTATNGAGCAASDAVVVTVNALPTVNAGADVSICAGGSTVIGTAASAGLTYSWSPAVGLSSSTVAQPTASPSATTTYTLTATNGAGCTASDAVVVTVNAMPTVNAGADASICIGGSTVIGTAASAGLTYSWSPAVGLSSTVVAQP